MGICNVVVVLRVVMRVQELRVSIEQVDMLVVGVQVLIVLGSEIVD